MWSLWDDVSELKKNHFCISGRLNDNEDKGKVYRKSHTSYHPKFMQAIQEFTTKVTRLGQRADSDNLLPAEIIIWCLDYPNYLRYQNKT